MAKETSNLVLSNFLLSKSRSANAQTIYTRSSSSWASGDPVDHDDILLLARGVNDKPSGYGISTISHVCNKAWVKSQVQATIPSLVGSNVCYSTVKTIQFKAPIPSDSSVPYRTPLMADLTFVNENLVGNCRSSKARLIPDHINSNGNITLSQMSTVTQIKGWHTKTHGNNVYLDMGG